MLKVPFTLRCPCLITTWWILHTNNSCLGILPWWEKMPHNSSSCDNPFAPYMALLLLRHTTSSFHLWSRLNVLMTYYQLWKKLWCSTYCTFPLDFCSHIITQQSNSHKTYGFEFINAAFNNNMPSPNTVVSVNCTYNVGLIFRHNLQFLPCDTHILNQFSILSIFIRPIVYITIPVMHAHVWKMCASILFSMYT